MGTPAQGHKSYMQFGRESTYGTAATVTHRVGFVSASIQPDIGIVRDPTLNNSVLRDTLYPVGERATGTIEMVMDYEGLLLLWDGVFGTGTYGNTGGTTTGAGPYAHAFVEKSFLNSYTIELIEGDVPTTKCQRLLGAKIVGFTVRGEAGQGENALVRVTWDIVAMSKTSNIAVTSPLTAVTRIPVLFHQSTIVDDGTADAAGLIRMRSFELKMESPIADDRFYLGSTTIDEPLRNDFCTTTLRVVKEFQSDTLLAAFKAGTAGSPQLQFTSGTNIYDFAIANAKLTAYSHEVSGYGILTQDATWEALLQAGSSPPRALLLTVTNSQAMIVT